MWWKLEQPVVQEKILEHQAANLVTFPCQVSDQTFLHKTHELFFCFDWKINCGKAQKTWVCTIVGVTHRGRNVVAGIKLD